MASEKKQEEIKKEITDPCTFANVNQFKATHTHLNLSVDFEKRVLIGNVDLSFDCISEKPASDIILDTRELNITSIHNTDDSNSTQLKYSLLAGNDKVATFGKPLQITLASPAKKGDKLSITIDYSTSPTAQAIQWLTPEQTVGKKHPYLFTQCQAIGARTMLPCQDSPSAKNTYSANITVNDKSLVALMSALPDGSEVNEKDKTVTYKHKQAVPCCSYLIALVVGNLEKRDLGKRTAVYSEPGMIEAAAFEFANTEKMLECAESICGKFVWGRYDVLLLPPSFPYGGMENPNLTFLTPTLIAGDRSLENVIAHEITHSWTGNLVTNLNWEHFWLNEGWTRFIESKIMGKMNGADQLSLDIANSQITLRQSVERLGKEHEFTKLNLSLTDTDPDDAFSSIPYEKGSEFLRYLEDLIGKPDVFAKFIKDYLNEFKFKCLDSYDFQRYFMKYFEKESKIKQINWKVWFKSPGMPPVMRKVESKLIKQSSDLVAKWSDFNENKQELKVEADDIKGWVVDQLEMFLDELYKNYKELLDSNKITKEQVRNRLQTMKKHYKFEKSKNIEILFRLNLIALAADDESQYESVLSILSTVGRMKFVRPLYRALIQNKKRVELAKQNYDKNRNFYHPICAKMVGQDLNKVDVQNKK